MNEEPGVHSFHAGFKRFPWGAFDCFVDKGIFGDDEFGGFRQCGTEFAELLDGEAFVGNAGDEVAVFELFFDCFDGFFFLRAADGGADCGGASGVFVGRNRVLG